MVNKVVKWVGDNIFVLEVVLVSLGLVVGLNVIEVVKKDLVLYVFFEIFGNSVVVGSFIEFEKGLFLKLINFNFIMLFMKGMLEVLCCGFS